MLYSCEYYSAEKIVECGTDNLYYLGKDKGISIFKIIYRDNLSYMIGNLVNCKREGIWMEYSSNDNSLRYKFTYSNDRRNGIFYSYTISGKIQTVGRYKDDQFDGPLIYFDLNNKIEKIEYWRTLGNSSELIYAKDLK